MLTENIEKYQLNGEPCKIWLRDDDAFSDVPSLRTLLESVPNSQISLAVIPGLMHPSLVNLLEHYPNVRILQHGWKHQNWNGIDSAPNEFPELRELEVMARELLTGLAILNKTFGPRCLPVFVPPWHNCSESVLKRSASIGFSAISMNSPCLPLLKRLSIFEINIEVDVTNWRFGGRFIGIQSLANAIERSCHVRRLWDAEYLPIGILTHHARMTNSDLLEFNQFLLDGVSKSIFEIISIEELMPDRIINETHDTPRS